MRLDPAECRRRFAAADHAVLAVNDTAGPPLVVPITFALIADPPRTLETAHDVLVCVVDHKPKSTRQLRRLRLAAADPRVSVLAEEYLEDWRGLWWVRADAQASVTTRESAPDAHRRAVTALAEKYAQYAGQALDGTVLWMRVARWSGWAGE